MNEWLADLRSAGTFLTRLPIPHAHTAVNFQRSMRVFPVVGAAIGLAVGLFQFGLLRLGLPPLAAAALGLGVSALLTGALHEDGVGDIADGFGGGRDKPAKLAIMRDSRLGTYGMLALMVGFSAKAAALAALPATHVIVALVVAHGLARSLVPAVAMVLPHAREDGLAVGAGRPNHAIVAIAFGLGLVITLIMLPWDVALGAIAFAATGAAGVAWLAHRQIGGHTGDVLGAAEQSAEVLILLFLAARWA